MPLKYRIAGTVFVLQTALVAALLWVTLTYSMESVRNQVAESEAVSMQLIGDLSRSALVTEDYANLQTFIEGTMRDPRIETVMLADFRGRVVVATTPEIVGTPLPTMRAGEHCYWRTQDVLGHSNFLGTLAVEFSDNALVTAYRKIQTVAILVAICGTLLIAVVAIAIGDVLTGRLQALADAADSVAAGQTTFPSGFLGTDEVARVARAFCGMVDRLQTNMAELKRTRDQLILPTEAMTQGFALWDSDDRLVLCNSRFKQLFREVRDHIVDGITFKDLSGRFQDHLMHGPSRFGPRQDWWRTRLTFRGSQEYAYELNVSNSRWIEAREARTADGGIVAIYTDITRERVQRHELQASEQRLREIMASVFYGIITVNETGTVDSVNQAAERMFGWTAEEIVGSAIGKLLVCDEPEDRSHRPMTVASVKSLPRHRVLEANGARKDGTIFPIEISMATIQIEGNVTHICAARDITERKAAEQRILYHATHDHLTSLPNRSEFNGKLAGILEKAKQFDESLAVVFLDLDRFKVINDSLGHPVGDALLIAVARRLRQRLRSADVVARLGGDEFVFLLPGIGDRKNAIAAVQKILDAMQSPFHVHGHELHVSASLGISLYPDHGATAELLLKHADIALYQAKAHGKNQLRLFAAGMGAQSNASITIESQLRHALERRQFQVLYQPQVDLRSGRMVGVEALLRWNHPQLGVVPPGQFIALAEETGLICPIGQWVFETACNDARTWCGAKPHSLRLAVNISARQFQEPHLARKVAETLNATGIGAGFLEFELTETILMREGDNTVSLIDALGEIGVGLALDDFGTGYSSLSYLKRYPIKRIKIDQSFVSDMESNENDSALVKATVATAHCMGIAVTAEGVETSGQIDLLRQFGCTEAQGFYLGYPVDADTITGMLRPI